MKLFAKLVIALGHFSTGRSQIPPGEQIAYPQYGRYEENGDAFAGLQWIDGKELPWGNAYSDYPNGESFPQYPWLSQPRQLPATCLENDTPPKESPDFPNRYDEYAEYYSDYPINCPPDYQEHPPPIYPSVPDETSSVKYHCEQKSCELKCIEYMSHNQGRCFDDLCYCRTTTDWSYASQELWPKQHPLCDNPKQSPVNLLERHFNDFGTKLQLVDYDAPINLIIENHGHGVRMYVQGAILPTMRIKDVMATRGSDVEKGNFGAPGDYTLGFIDLHWNTSEHAFEGVKFDMEAQFHHFGLQHDTYEEALAQPSGTLVLAVLFELSDEESSLSDDMFEAMEEAKTAGNASAGTIVGPQSFLVALELHLGHTFAAYVGSETTPPCNPMRWLVAKNLLQVTDVQLKHLQRLQDLAGNSISKNVRNLQ